MRTLRGRLLPVGAGLVVMCGTAGVAQAATPNVKTVVKAQDKIIRRSPEYAKLKTLNVTTAAQARTAATEIGALRQAVDHAATVVSKSSTTSARQRAGRNLWVAGARKLGNGLAQLKTGLMDAARGDKTAAKAEIVKADKTMAAADAMGVKADREIGLPTTY